MQRTLLTLAAAVTLVAALAQAAPAKNLAIRGAVCAVPYTDASIVKPAPPELPQIAKEQGVSGSAVVEIRLAPSGTLVARKVAVSSGNAWLDREALASAAQSKYVPETQDCAAVGGTYLLTVDFNS